MNAKQIFITGATGFIGSALTVELLRRGHDVKALTRPRSAKKLPSGCKIVHGDALNATSYAAQITPADTFVHLVGVSHPSPSKGVEFRSIDLQSIRQASAQQRRPAYVTSFISASPGQLPSCANTRRSGRKART